MTVHFYKSITTSTVDKRTGLPRSRRQVPREHREFKKVYVLLCNAQKILGKELVSANYKDVTCRDCLAKKLSIYQTKCSQICDKLDDVVRVENGL